MAVFSYFKDKKKYKEFNDEVLRLATKLDGIRTLSDDFTEKNALRTAINILRTQSDSRLNARGDQLSNIIFNLKTIDKKISEQVEDENVSGVVSYTAYLLTFLKKMSAVAEIAGNTIKIEDELRGVGIAIKNDALESMISSAESEKADLCSRREAFEKEITAYARGSSEYNGKQQRIEALSDNIARINDRIYKLNIQIANNEGYESIEREIRYLKNVLSYAAYGSLEELETAIRKYIEIHEIVSAEQEEGHEMIKNVSALAKTSQPRSNSSNVTDQPYVFGQTSSRRDNTTNKNQQ